MRLSLTSRPSTIARRMGLELWMIRPHIGRKIGYECRRFQFPGPGDIGDGMARSEVLIIGAGPTGLVLALWLTKLGVKVRIVDKTAEPGTTSRALAVQARTLELYRQLDLADAVVERGNKVPAVNLWVKGEPAARVPFETVGSDLTPYSFLQIFPQDQHERLLIARLEALSVSVERQTELVGFTDAGERVTARLRGPRWTGG